MTMVQVEGAKPWVMFDEPEDKSDLEIPILVSAVHRPSAAPGLQTLLQAAMVIHPVVHRCYPHSGLILYTRFFSLEIPLSTPSCHVTPLRVPSM